MPFAAASDGVQLHYEVAGAGDPVLFLHEFAGDIRSWEPQIACFARRYRCVAFNARGYPPSEVPADPSAYSQQIAVSDATAVLDSLGIRRTHVVGLSMGAFAALHLALQRPDFVRSAVIASCGYGAHPAERERFRAECEARATAYEQEGSASVAMGYAVGPARVQFQNKDPRGWSAFAHRLAEHSADGAARTLRAVLRERPSLYELTDDLARLEVPILIIVGDEDEGCLEPGLLLKRTIGASGLLVLPRSGHTLNLENPSAFNGAVASFFAEVERGAWTERDPRAASTSMIDGVDG
jgi:pimeloyl-ACP methyl ester carboxylesterase